MTTLRITQILTDEELSQLAELHKKCIGANTTFNKAAVAWIEARPKLLQRLHLADIFPPYFAYAIENMIPRK